MLGFDDEESHTSAMDFFMQTVLKIRENEAREKGITLEEQYNLPPETVMHPGSEKILKDACDELDKKMKN